MTDRFDDLDLREEPAGIDRSNSDTAYTQVGCTQYTFACAADNVQRTPICCF